MSSQPPTVYFVYAASPIRPRLQRCALVVFTRAKNQISVRLRQLRNVVEFTVNTMVMHAFALFISHRNAIKVNE